MPTENSPAIEVLGRARPGEIEDAVAALGDPESRLAPLQDLMLTRLGATRRIRD